MQMNKEQCNMRLHRMQSLYVEINALYYLLVKESTGLIDPVDVALLLSLNNCRCSLEFKGPHFSRYFDLSSGGVKDLGSRRGPVDMAASVGSNIFDFLQVFFFLLLLDGFLRSQLDLPRRVLGSSCIGIPSASGGSILTPFLSFLGRRCSAELEGDISPTKSK